MFPEHISGQICHELGHVIREADTRNPNIEQVSNELFDPINADRKKESRKEEIVDRFPDPLRHQTRIWDQLSKQTETINKIKREAWFVDWEIFEAEIFGDKQEELNKRIANAIPKELLNNLDEP